MMKVYVITLLMVLSAGVYAQELKEIKLNAPNKTRGVSVMEAFDKRRSYSEFSAEKLSLQDMSDLLWAACGINRPENGKKTAPSAQNAQEIDVYVCLEEGTYLYDVLSHSLKPVTSTDLRPFANGRSPELPPCILLIVAETSRYNARNDKEHVLDMSKVDAGIVSQNISLCCAGLGLGTKPRAGMKQDELREALSLGETQLLLLNHPIGYIK